MSMKIPHYSHSILEYYGAWLPTPLIDKISIKDYSIDVQVSLMLNPLKDVYDPETEPQEIAGNLRNKTNVYVFWALGENTHKAAENYSIPPLTMLSGSGGMNTNFSSFFGGHPNYQIAEFTLEPEEYTVEGVLYHKYTSTVSLQIGALDGDTYSFNPVNQEYIWGKDYFDILSYEEGEQREAAKQKLFNMYIYSVCVSKEEEEEILTMSDMGYEDSYDYYNKERTRFSMLSSDLSYVRLFRSDEEYNYALIDNRPKPVFINDESSVKGIYRDIPIMSLDGFYYKQQTVTFSLISREMQNLLGNLQLSEQEIEDLNNVNSINVVNNLKYIYQQFLYTPRILVELYEALQMWPDRMPTSGAGRLYNGVKNTLEKINRSFDPTDRLDKVLMYASKIVDARGQEDLAEWCPRHKTFMGNENPPTVRETDYEPFSTYEKAVMDLELGDAYDWMMETEQNTATFKKYLSTDDMDDYVIYSHHFMHRAGLGYDDTSVDFDEIEADYIYEYIQNKGYWFVDIERILNNYVISSQLWSTQGVEGLIGRAATNSFLGKHQEVTMVRYNSKLSDEENIDLVEMICNLQMTTEPDSDDFASLQKGFIHKNYYYTYDNSEFSIDNEDAGASSVQIENYYNPTIDAMDTYSEPRTYYSYLVPRNFDLIADSNLSESFGNYRLLCMSYQDIYPYPTSLLGIESESEISQNEFYHATFRFKDKSIVFVKLMVEDLLEKFAAFSEYADLALEACSYNNYTGNFNQFFTSAMATRYEDQQPWYEAAVAYYIHLQLLYEAFGTNYLSVVTDINDAAINLSSQISPGSGNIESIQLLLSSMESLVEFYVGSGYTTSTDPSDVFVEDGDYADGAATSLFYKYYNFDEDESSEDQGLLMTFENELTCFPDIIFADSATGLETVYDELSCELVDKVYIDYGRKWGISAVTSQGENEQTILDALETIGIVPAEDDEDLSSGVETGTRTTATVVSNDWVDEMVDIIEDYIEEYDYCVRSKNLGKGDLGHKLVLDKQMIEDTASGYTTFEQMEYAMVAYSGDADTFYQRCGFGLSTEQDIPSRLIKNYYEASLCSWNNRLLHSK